MRPLVLLLMSKLMQLRAAGIDAEDLLANPRGQLRFYLAIQLAPAMILPSRGGGASSRCIEAYYAICNFVLLQEDARGNGCFFLCWLSGCTHPPSLLWCSFLQSS